MLSSISLFNDVLLPQVFIDKLHSVSDANIFPSAWRGPSVGNHELGAFEARGGLPTPELDRKLTTNHRAASSSQSSIYRV